MTSRVRQYPRVKQRVDRTFASSPANSLLYTLSAIRELYNSSNDGRSASDIRELGYDQLVAFLHIDMRMSEDKIQQHLRLRSNLPGSSQLNGLCDFVRWSTSHVWEWASTGDERITIVLDTFKRVEDRLCLESLEWQKIVEEDPYMGELEAKRFSTLLSLLKDSFAALVRHHAAVTNYHHSLGFREIEMVIEEADMMLEPYHHCHSEVWSWSEHEGHAKRVEETLPMLLAVLNGDGETASCFRVEFALLLFLPLMPQLLWVETLEQQCGLGNLAAELEREFELRNDRRLGFGLRGKLGSMLGNDKKDKEDEEDVDMGEGKEAVDVDVGVQLEQLRITDGGA